MRLAAFLSLSLLATPALAQDWIDYGLLMRENVDKAVSARDANGVVVQSLDFGDGVVVQCSDGSCFGTDSAGALGCTFAIMLDMTALNSTCPGNLDAAATARLEAGFARMGRFIEENAVPRRDPGYAQGLLEAAIKTQSDMPEAERMQTCQRLKPGPEGDLAGMLSHLSGADFMAALEEGLAKPRLPVMNPCL